MSSFLFFFILFTTFRSARHNHDRNLKTGKIEAIDLPHIWSKKHSSPPDILEVLAREHARRDYENF